VAFLLLFSTVSVAKADGTLVLLVDLSASISEENVKLQLESYATAMEWITPLDQFNVEVVIFGKKYDHISSGTRYDAARAFRREINLDRSSTCLYDTLSYIRDIYYTLPQPVIIDISGDGEENCNTNFQETYDLLDSLQMMGAKINTLMIPLNRKVWHFLPNEQAFAMKESELRGYYETLIRGEGSFFMYIENFYDFEEAIIRKIVREIAFLR
jgi:hypothetical protein